MMTADTMPDDQQEAALHKESLERVEPALFARYWSRMDILVRMKWKSVALIVLAVAGPLSAQSWTQRIKDKAKQAAAAAAATSGQQKPAPSTPAASIPANTGVPTASAQGSLINPDLAYSWCSVGLSLNNPTNPTTNVYSDIFLYNIRETRADAEGRMGNDIAWQEHLKSKFGTVGWNSHVTQCYEEMGSGAEARAKEKRQASLNHRDGPWKVLEDHWTYQDRPAIPTDAYVGTNVGTSPPAGYTPVTAPQPSQGAHHPRQNVPTLHHWYCSSYTLDPKQIYFSAPFDSMLQSMPLGDAYAAFLKNKYGYASTEAGGALPCFGSYPTLEAVQAAIDEQVSAKQSRNVAVIKTNWKPSDAQ